MITKTELNVQLWTGHNSRMVIRQRQVDGEMGLKYKKLVVELEMAITKLEDEIVAEKAELARDKALYKLAEKPTVVAATKTTKASSTPPDEKALINQKHDLKMKAAKIKQMEKSLPVKVENLKTQFEIDYRDLKTTAEDCVEAKKQIGHILDYYKERVEHGYNDEE